jgi:mannose-6-phosphate isomerase-like protein (cupin superfamily)
MQAFDFSPLREECSRSGGGYLEFLRHPSLSVGLYMLAAGAVDQQEPHSEDEVYYIVNGRGSIMVAGENRIVAAGSLVFVAANVEHRFHTITEDLEILVIFAPAEYTNAPRNGG